MRTVYPWILAFAIFWALVALVVTFLRFGELPGDSEQIFTALLGFFLAGAISGLVLISLLRRTSRRSGKMLVIVGYTLAAPFGYAFGIVGPLTLEGLGRAQLPSSIDYFLLYPLAIGLYGSVPPICGALIGFLAGRIRERST